MNWQEKFNEEKRKPASQREIKPSPLLIKGFVERYLLDKYDNPVPVPDFHIGMWEMACSDDPRVAIAAPREHAKSTAITKAYTLVCLLFRYRDFAVIVSDTYAQSVEFVKELKIELTENEQIIADFGVKVLDTEREDDIIIRLRDDYLFRVVARGTGQKVRGLKWRNKRPNLIIGDDMEGDEQVESKERREKCLKWVMKALIPAGNKDKCLYRFVGTILHDDSVLNRLLKSPSWATRRLRAHEAFDDFRNILWPDAWPEHRLKDRRQVYIDNGDPDGYSQEYLNDPIAEGSSHFRKTDLLDYPEGGLGREQVALMRKYAAWDLAISKTEKADFSCCVVIGIDSDGLIYVLDVVRGRWDSKEIIDKMFLVEKVYRPEVTLVEEEKISKAIGPFLYDEMRKTQIYINLELVKPSKDKVLRSRSWQAKVRAKSVHYDKSAEWWPNVEQELVRFPKAEHDDTVDPQSYLGLFLDGLVEGNTEKEAANEEYEEEFGRVIPMGRNATTGY